MGAMKGVMGEVVDILVSQEIGLRRMDGTWVGVSSSGWVTRNSERDSWWMMDGPRRCWMLSAPVRDCC